MTRCEECGKRLPDDISRACKVCDRPVCAECSDIVWDGRKGAWVCLSCIEKESESNE